MFAHNGAIRDIAYAIGKVFTVSRQVAPGAKSAAADCHIVTCNHRINTKAHTNTILQQHWYNWFASQQWAYIKFRRFSNIAIMIYA